jgi:hypothetical protein
VLVRKQQTATEALTERKDFSWLFLFGAKVCPAHNLLVNLVLTFV